MVVKFLKDKVLDQHLLKQGFVLIPFLQSSTVAELLEKYYQFHVRYLEGIYTTANIRDRELRDKMSSVIKENLSKQVDKTFVNHNYTGAAFIAKGKGEHGSQQPHQDWNIVDEEKYRSFNIWTPLVDLRENNGVIRILPGSHLWFKTYRSASIPSAYTSVNNLLWKKMKPLYMKAGEALIYDRRLLHASGPNRSDEILLAAIYGIKQAGAPALYYHKADERNIEAFESNSEFFPDGNYFERPRELKLINKFPFDFPVITEEQLYARTGWERQIESDRVTTTISPSRDSFFKKLGRALGQE